MVFGRSAARTGTAWASTPPARIGTGSTVNGDVPVVGSATLRYGEGGSGRNSLRRGPRGRRPRGVALSGRGRQDRGRRRRVPSPAHTNRTPGRRARMASVIRWCSTVGDPVRKTVVGAGSDIPESDGTPDGSNGSGAGRR